MKVRKNEVLKRGIWAYFLLLIFEGALRKWVFPDLATPLLIVRDPLALWLILLAWSNNLLYFNFIMAGMALVGVLSFFTGFYLGHGNLYVTLYGSRIYLLQFPLIYVIGNVFTMKDVIKLGKITLWLSIPMIVLIAIQFHSPQSAWVNRGVGGDIKGAGFGAVLGYFRPPGTFSFTNGTSLFFSFAAAFIVYFWYNTHNINKILLVLATICLIASIPFSISRALLFSIIISFLFGLAVALRKPKYLGRAIFASLTFLFLLFILGKSDLFQNAAMVFNARYEMANRSEGSLESALIDRYLGGAIGAIEASTTQPYFGYGSGMGTNVGAVLLTGKRSFLISEGEWGRLIGELGLTFGLAIIFFRLSFSLQLIKKSYQEFRYGNLLPWFLLSCALANIPQGQWAQPTSLGFAVMTGGLLLASLGRNEI